MAQRETGKWVWKPKGSKFWQYEFALRNDRFRGSTGLTAKKEAERFAREQREREIGRSARELQARGKLKGKPKDMTFLRAVERYWQEAGQFIANLDNRNSDERAFCRLVEWVGEETMLSDIDQSLCAEIVAKRRGQTFGGKPVSAATVNRQTVELLSRVLMRARDIWGVPHLQAIRWRKLRLKEAGARRRTISFEEEVKIEERLREGFGLALRLSLESGLRLQNLTGLKWSEVDAENCCLRIIQKGDKEHTVPISPPMLEALEAERGNHPVQVFTFVPAKSVHNRHTGTTYVKGRRYPLTYSGFQAWFVKLRDEIGAPDLRPHDLRRTAATRLLRSTGNLKAAQTLLGHADITTTARAYAHVLDEDMSELLTKTLKDQNERKARALGAKKRGRFRVAE